MVPEDDDFDVEEAECPTCGAIIPLEAEECPECGQLFEEEEELWDEEEEEEEWETEEWMDVEPSKTKLYLGIFIILFGSIGLTFMSWFHNVIGIFHDAGIGGYPGYGPIDQMVGASGAIVTLIGVIIIYLWYKDTKEAEEVIDEDEYLEDEEYFEDEEDEFLEEEEVMDDEDYDLA